MRRRMPTRDSSSRRWEGSLLVLDLSERDPRESFLFGDTDRRLRFEDLSTDELSSYRCVVAKGEWTSMNFDSRGNIESRCVTGGLFLCFSND